MEVVEEHGKRWPAARGRIRDGLQALALAGVLVVLIRALALESLYIPSRSMRPTLEPGDTVLVNRIVYRVHPPRRGDIIVFRSPQNEAWDFVKRVIAVSGDVVEERGGRLRVNGAPVAEPAPVPAGTDQADEAEIATRRIPLGRLFVLGDNRDASFDSRFWGTVDEERVIGKAAFILWSRGTHWWDIRWERIGRWLS